MTIKNKLTQIGKSLGLAGLLTLAGVEAKANEPNLFVNEQKSYNLNKEDYESFNGYREPIADFLPKTSSKSLIGKTMETGTGALSGLLAHELGHKAAAEITRENITSNLTSYSYENSNSETGKAITALGGPLISIIATKVALQGERNPYNIGFATYGIADNLVKAIAPGLRGEDKNDLDELEGLGINPNLIRIGLGINALWDAYQLVYGDNSDSKSDKWDVYARPLSNGGLEFGLEYKF